MRLSLPSLSSPHVRSAGPVATPDIPEVAGGGGVRLGGSIPRRRFAAHLQRAGKTIPGKASGLRCPDHGESVATSDRLGRRDPRRHHVVPPCSKLHLAGADQIARSSRGSVTIGLHLERWLALCGSRRKNIQLKISPVISCPIAVGPFRPAILVPPAFFQDLSDSEIDQAGLHEMAHLARRDDYALLLQRVIEALLPWHPAVRWITRQIDLEREIACDDFVVERLHQPRSYASCLTHLAELASRQRPSLLAAGAITEGSHLTHRVELLLDRTRHTGTRLLRFRLAGVALIPLDSGNLRGAGSRN